MTTRTDELRRSRAAAFPLGGAAAWLGALALGACLAAVLFLPNGWLQVGLAGLAVALLAFDRRLGPLPAAMLVMLAVPVGRGAEVGLPEISGNPVRPHDLAAGIGLLAAAGWAVVGARGRALARLRRPQGVAILVFLGAGLLALGIGLLSDNALRDVARDARWWGLYAAGLLALLIGIAPPAIVRALVWGMTLYSAVVLLGMLMPDFEGGLKIGAFAYDERMRLHYGQAIFLVPALAYAAWHASRGSLPWLAVTVLLAAAAGLTLTRALILVAIAVPALVAAWTAWRARPSLRHLALAGVPVVLAAAIGCGAGLAAYQVGIQIWAVPEGSSRSPSEGPNPGWRPIINTIDRITGREGHDFAAQGGGRLLSYADAFVASSDAPVLGHGMGELARVGWAWGGFRASTIGSQPGVDNAYLTVALKAGALGVAALAAMLLWPLRTFLARPRWRLWAWYLPAWLAVLGLTLIESFAVSGYAPFALGLLLVLPALRGGGGGWSPVATPG